MQSWSTRKLRSHTRAQLDPLLHSGEVSGTLPGLDPVVKAFPPPPAWSACTTLVSFHQAHLTALGCTTAMAPLIHATAFGSAQDTRRAGECNHCSTGSQRRPPCLSSTQTACVAVLVQAAAGGGRQAASNQHEFPRSPFERQYAIAPTKRITPVSSTAVPPIYGI